MSDVTFDVWLACVPSRTYKGDVGSSGIVKKMWQKKPPKSALPAGAVAVRVTLEVDSAVFMPIEPKVTIHVDPTPLQLIPEPVRGRAKVPTQPPQRSDASKEVFG
jgi:hypothetical protein